MKTSFNLTQRKKKRTTLLGLVLDGSRLDGVVLKRTNGSLQKLQSFSVSLALDPLTAAPELVGREIRNHLDAAGVRERDCIFGLPLKWVLTAPTEIPAGLPDADAASLLQLEAEKGFHADVATLQVAESRSTLAADRTRVLLAGVPTTHLGTLEQVLVAARLKPRSFSLGISALQRPEATEGVLALRIGETQVGLQITAGGGVLALRSLEGTVENQSGRSVLFVDAVLREVRITLGQLPAEPRHAVKRIRIFGPPELAQSLAAGAEARFVGAGLKIEVVSAYRADEFGATLPADAPVSAAFSLAANFLIERKPAFEFLPPKPSPLEQLVKKYSSGKFGRAGAVGVGVVGLVLLIFLIQQIQLWSLRTQWSRIQGKVTELQAVQDDIRQYRPWYDDTFQNLSILRQLSLAFPEDGSVTARNIEIRGNEVTCSGTARDYGALLKMQTQLRGATGVSGVKLQQIRGKAPMQFVFGFNYNPAGGAQ